MRTVKRLALIVLSAHVGRCERVLQRPVFAQGAWKVSGTEGFFKLGNVGKSATGCDLGIRATIIVAAEDGD